MSLKKYDVAEINHIIHMIQRERDSFIQKYIWLVGVSQLS